MKICVYAISKNEEQFVKRFCDSAKDADLIVIADTGSTDNTVAIAKECGATVYNISIKPWRFDRARIACLGMVPKDIDVCIALDLDEILMDGWRNEIEQLWKDKVNILEYGYDWGDNLVFKSCKIHSRGGWVWKGICHEQVLPDPRTSPVFAKTEKVLIKQLRDSTKSRQSYLDLMAAEVMENPDNIRSKMYYARELGINNNLEECLTELDKCIDALNNVDQRSSNDSLSLDEISYIYCTKAKCLDRLNRYTEAVATFKAACEIMPKREPMLDFAMYCLQKEDYSSCFHYASQALMIPQPKFSTFLDDPTCFGFKPWNLRAISAFRLGMIEIAIESAKMALQLDPNNENLKGNLEYFEEIEKNQNKDNQIKVI